MKRNFIIITVTVLVTVLALFTFGWNEKALYAAEEVKTGDVNGDNSIDALDFALMKAYIIGAIKDFPVNDDLAVGDLNRDGSIDAIDWATLKMYLLRIYKVLPVIENSKSINGNIQSIASNSRDSFVLTKDGTLYGWGYNNCGELGTNSYKSTDVPVVIMTDVKQFSVGGDTFIGAQTCHILIVKKDGSLWGCGSNGCNELGKKAVSITTSTNITTPIKLVDSGVVLAKASAYTSVFLKDDGSVWAIGSNSSGQMGLPSEVNAVEPVKICDNAIDIAANSGQTYYITEDNTLWGIGSNNFNGLGIAEDSKLSSKFIKPRAILTNVSKVVTGGDCTLAIQKNGNILAWGVNDSFNANSNYEQNGLSMKQISINSRVTDVALGCNHAIFLLENGDVATVGANSRGELGDGAQKFSKEIHVIAHNASMIAAGEQHSLYVDNKGVLWGFGKNEQFQLASKTINFSTIPIRLFN